jgi:hypothetical protein
MTILTIRPLRIRAATALLKPGVLDSILRSTCRLLAEAAKCQAGELCAKEGRDPIILWTGFGQGECSQLRACRTACDIVRRLELRELKLARQHGVALCPHIGIASDGRDGAADSGDGRVLDRAQILRQANQLYGTTILVDSIVAAGAERRMALRQVDRIRAGGHGLLRGPEATAVTGIAAAKLGVFASTPGTIHEVLGPQGVVPVGRRSAAVAFEGALELYQAGAWSNAAAVFSLLATGTRPDPLAGLYLHKCRQHEEEDQRLARALACESPVPAVSSESSADSLAGSVGPRPEAPSTPAAPPAPSAASGERPHPKGAGEI